MLFMITLLFSFSVNAMAIRKHQFLLDYFRFKRISYVVGFTCNEINDDVDLTNEFSKIGMAVALHKLTNETSIKLLARTTHQKLGIFLDVNCYDPNSINLVFSEASDNYMFDDLRYWLILSPGMPTILEVIEDRSFGLSTDFVISIDSSDEKYDLFDVYNTCKEHGGTINVTFLGTWYELDGVDIALKQERFPRRSNLNNMILKAIFFHLKYKPSNVSIDDYLQEYQHPISEGQNRFAYSLLKHLADLHNFSLVSNQAEVPNPNDTFGTHVRLLANNLADISGSPMIISRQRMYFIKYTVQVWPFRTCFIFRNPQPRNIKIQEILRPFVNKVWYFIAALMILNTITLTLMSKYESSETRNKRISNSVLLNVGLMCLQGSTEQSKRLSTRVTLLVIMIFTFLIFLYYSSSVVSARLSEQIYKINDSLNEFGKLHLKMASHYMPYFKLLLNYPNWETRLFYENFMMKIPESKWFMEPDIGMHLVQEGGFAYHAHPEASYPYANNHFSNMEICELMEVHLAKPMLTTFAIRYNSTLTEMARVGLTKISEVGLRKRQVLKWENRKPLCRKDILSASSITIDEFASHLILLGIGMTLAILINIFENILFCFKSVQRNADDFTV